jgi:hypothetical protein
LRVCECVGVWLRVAAAVWLCVAAAVCEGDTTPALPLCVAERVWLAVCVLDPEAVWVRVFDRLAVAVRVRVCV